MTTGNEPLHRVGAAVEKPTGISRPRRPTARPWLPLVSVEGAFANVFIVLTGGAFLTGLALHLGANDFEIGLLGAIPFLAQLAQLLSAYLIDHGQNRKKLTVWSSVLARQIWWLIVPILLLKGEWRLEAFLTILVISSASIMVATPGWMSWMAELVPDRVRGRYFGMRSSVIAITTLAATIVGGFVLDGFHVIHREGLGFAVIFGAGCAFALAAVTILNRLPDIPASAATGGFSWSNLMKPIKNRNFRHLLLVFGAWNLAVGIAAAFFAAHMLVNLKMSFGQIALYLSVAPIIGIVLNRPWGAVIDRFGSKPVIVLSTFGIALIPLIWLFPRPGFLWILALEAVYSGILWTGFNLAAFTVPIANSPRRARTTYLAVFSVVTGIAFFVASLAGGTLAETWRFVHWQVGKQTIVNYQLLFAISAVLRLAAASLVLTFHEPGEKKLPVMVQFMGYSMLKRLSVGRQIFPPFVRKHLERKSCTICSTEPGILGPGQQEQTV
jgi:MFS family permease